MIHDELQLYQQRIARIRESLNEAALPRWGCAPKIVAVSKTIDAERVNLVRSAGITTIGENRVQELLEKYPHLDASFEIDLIGRLQSNKVKYIIDKVQMIHSLDRESLALEIDRRAQMRGCRIPVLIQVNIGEESQKGGVEPDNVLDFARHAAQLPGLDIRGLMAIMPDLDDEQQLRPFFIRMRGLFEQLRSEAIQGTNICELSMGMSGDYHLAAQEGATIVRIGSAIFGTRGMQQKQSDLKGDIG